ncbi:polysaccharide deacetylase family protein [Oribacterium parvum]|uniref:polysaccharide deacetylase family protein n=1 Tax=Oribacterium parvum TaxID=1501329 RepID=UPI0028E6FC7B|nr:polysaccharide deacetylase family protein [Oribacterium parvum]
MTEHDFEEINYQKKMEEHRKKMERRMEKRRRDRQSHILLFVLALILLLLAFVGFRFAIPYLQKRNLLTPNKESVPAWETGIQPLSSEGETGEEENSGESSTLSEKEKAIKTADLQAKQYDYDGAIATLNALSETEDTDVSSKIAEYEEAKAKLVPVDMNNITHIFFHILIVDTDRALKDTHQGRQYNSVMTTIPEFKEVIQEMYDRGYVMVHMHDIAEMQEQADGTKKMVKKQIMLPEGKKPFVMSEDDVNYYIYMQGSGFADKMVLDENGKPKLQYTDKDGNVSVGDYDLVPILDAFVEEHPDFAYHGHKAVLAFTGYNGVLGYRTDETFDPNSPALDPKNKANPNIEEDKETVKKLTQALKSDGYEFASHSWGHINFSTRSLEAIQKDTDRWERNVEPLLPDPCEILLYPFGADIGDWHPYQSGQQDGKFDLLENAGFHYFCNVDSTQVWMQYGDQFLRQGRRNIDGYRLYESYIGKADRLSDLFDVKKVFDTRRPTPINWE